MVRSFVGWHTYAYVQWRLQAPQIHVLMIAWRDVGDQLMSIWGERTNNLVASWASSDDDILCVSQGPLLFDSQFYFASGRLFLDFLCSELTPSMNEKTPCSMHSSLFDKIIENFIHLRNSQWLWDYIPALLFTWIFACMPKVSQIPLDTNTSAINVYLFG